MKAITDCSLYGIIDGDYAARDHVCSIVSKMLTGGIDILQLRAKNWTAQQITETAHAIHSLTREKEVPLIINDYPDIAKSIGAEGIHVGQDDLTVHDVRQIVGSDMLVGLSTHSLEQARLAATQDIDYIGFGPLFSTPTKPDYPAIGTNEIAQVHLEHPQLPVFCIGGIKLDNAASVIEAGARRIVVVSGILQAEDIENYTKNLKSLL